VELGKGLHFLVPNWAIWNSFLCDWESKAWESHFSEKKLKFLGAECCQLTIGWYRKHFLLPLHKKLCLMIVLLRLYIRMAQGFCTWNQNFPGSARPKATKGYLLACKLEKSWVTTYLMELE
jgi:hypothetical protein